MKKELDELGFGEKRCPICKKVFIPPTDDWVYKRKRTTERITYFCSWGCMNKYDLQHPKKIAVQQREDIIRLIHQGKKTAEIVRTLGVERSKVRYWQERVAKEEEGE